MAAGTEQQGGMAQMAMDKDRTLEDLRGSFSHAWLLLSGIDVIWGILGFSLLDGMDLNRWSTALFALGFVASVDIFAFICGARFRADRNRGKLVDDAQALINTYKAAAEKVEQDCDARIHECEARVHEYEARVLECEARIHQTEMEKEHEITRLTTQLEGERTRVMQAIDKLAEETARRVVHEEVQPISTDEIDAIFVTEAADASQLEAGTEQQGVGTE
jgi:hypothetical protein